MAKQILLKHGDDVASFDFKKLARDKIYGKRTRVMLDNDGEPCSRASLTADGSLLIEAGMTAQGYFDDEGTWIENKALVGLDPDGNVVDAVPSTLGVAQDLTGPVDPTELMDARIYAIYMLDAADLSDDLRARLEGGEIFSAPFNYRPDYRPEVSFILHNDEGLFALVGNPAEPAWVDLDLPAAPVVEEEDDDFDDDDIDFDMF